MTVPTNATTVIAVPSSLDDLTCEHLFDQLAACPRDARITLDARHCTFATPYGLTAMLAIAETRAEKPLFLAPDSADNVSYWARAGFFRFAEEFCDVQGMVPRSASAGESDLLLEVTRVPMGEGADAVISHVEERAFAIFTSRLQLEPRTGIGLASAVAAACRNMVDHAGRSGWVMIQAYHFRKKLGTRSVVVASVCDAGVAGRGGVQQLSAFRGYVYGHDAKLSVRSGTARVALVPRWDDDVPLRENLAPFPGVQLQLTMPGQATEQSA